MYIYIYIYIHSVCICLLIPINDYHKVLKNICDVSGAQGHAMLVLGERGSAKYIMCYYSH